MAGRGASPARPTPAASGQERWWTRGLIALAVVVVVLALVVIWPMLWHQTVSSTRTDTPSLGTTSLQVSGVDGRTRTLQVSADGGGTIDPSALVSGEHLVVTGSGYDVGQGVYVAICELPDDLAKQPDPCIDTSTEPTSAPVQHPDAGWSPNAWIANWWAWRIFGARPYDDASTGSFTVHLVVGDAAGKGIDCTANPCAIVTRDDHTAIGDRGQDLVIPIRFQG